MMVMVLPLKYERPLHSDAIFTFVPAPLTQLLLFDEAETAGTKANVETIAIDPATRDQRLAIVADGFIFSPSIICVIMF